MRALLGGGDVRGLTEARAALHRGRAVGALARAAGSRGRLQDNPSLTDLVALTEFATHRTS